VLVKLEDKWFCHRSSSSSYLTSSSSQSMFLVMNMPVGLSWNRKDSGLLEGWRGSHHGSPPNRWSRAMSLASISYSHR